MSAEILHTCPACQRSGFTARGIKAHECRTLGRRLNGRELLAIAGHGPQADLPAAPSSTSPMSTSKSNKHALTVFADPKLTKGIDTTELARLAIEQIGVLASLQREDAFRFVFLGITLQRLKTATQHGKFSDVLKDVVAKSKGWTASTTNKNASYAMRLASIFVETEKLHVTDLVALHEHGGALQLGTDNGPAGRIFTKLAKFCGDLSRTELLIKHGIKAVGLKTELEADADESLAGQAEDYFAVVAERLERWRKVCTDRSALMRLSPQQLDTVHQAMTDGYSQFKRLYQEARGATTVDV